MAHEICNCAGKGKGEQNKGKDTHRSGVEFRLANILYQAAVYYCREYYTRWNSKVVRGTDLETDGGSLEKPPSVIPLLLGWHCQWSHLEPH